MRKKVDGSRIGVGMSSPSDLTRLLLSSWFDETKQEPLVLEVTNPQTKRVRLYVVWDAWKTFSKAERDAIVYNALEEAEVQQVQDIPRVDDLERFEGLTIDEARSIGLDTSAESA